MFVAKSGPVTLSKVILAVSMTGLLLGCNATSKLSDLARDEDGFSQAISSHEASLRYNQQREISTQSAVARLRDRPHGILSATERPYRNGFAQRIVYPVSSRVWGENFIDIRVTGRRTKRKPDEKLILHSSRLPHILTEARNALGDKTVSLTDDNLLQNAYGPYGLIYLKRAGKIGCLFGWQTLLNEDGKNIHHLLPSESAGWPSRQGLSYRVRYCAKNLSLDGARDVMERIYLKPEFGRIWFDGADDDKIDPINTASVSAVAKEVAIRPEPTVRTSPRRSTAVIEEASSPFVPLPEGAGTLARQAISVPTPDAVVPDAVVPENEGSVVVPMP